MPDIHDIAEPMHLSPVAGAVGSDPGYNAGIDALVDAVQQQGYVLVPKAEAEALIAAGQAFTKAVTE